MVSVIIPKKPSLKRKLGTSKTLQRKKLKKELPKLLEEPNELVESLDTLPWRTVSRPREDVFEGEDGFLELEEVDDVEVVYEETDAGKIVKFKVHEHADSKIPKKPIAEEDSEDEGDDLPTDTFDTATLLHDWLPYPLHARLLASLHSQNFHKPTPIQAAALPLALQGRDIVGVAETGSGKTLAYGLPILQHILTCKRGKPRSRSLKALILAPTRELALQVADHLHAAIRGVETETKGKENDEGSKAIPLVSIAAVVGGMSEQKQKRLLARGVDILIATPGRLWDLIEQDDNLADQLKKLRFLVLDEADRMIETGHFEELDNIIRLTRREAQTDEADPEFKSIDQGKEELDESKEENATEPGGSQPNAESLQTLIFSATLSRDLQRNLKKRQKKLGQRLKSTSTLDELLMKLDFRDPEPAIVDLSPEGGAVASLRESIVECLTSDKDAILYYFLLRYPGKTLVFLSAIDGIRRLQPLMDLLQIKAFPLHSQLQQRQRLKNLDRFKSTPNAVLLATDVAARGLDVPAVDHVLHYQAPRTADAYVHRCGRTARAAREGFSLLMSAPEERGIVKALMTSLGRVGDKMIPEMPIEYDLIDKLKSRVQLARKIDQTQHKVKKEKHEKNWLREAAEAMEIELDSELEEASDDDSSANKKRQQNKHVKEVHALKEELRHLLSQPLVASGISKKYLTSGSRNVVHDLLDGEHPERMLGFKKGDAKSAIDLANGKEARRRKKTSKA